VDVGPSREAVLLLDQSGHTHALCGGEQGTARVATHSHGHVRAEGPDQRPGLEHAAEHLPGQREVLDDGAPLESTDREAFDAVAGRRHLLHLHPSFGAHEQELGIGLALAHGVRYGDGREDVTAGASTGDHHPKLLLCWGA